MKESARYLLPILVFVALILSIGTGGYLIIEDGITVSDAFYLTVTAITPTQFDEVHKLSVRGRYFTVVLVFCGFGAVVAFATQFARLIIQSELEGVGVITRKQMRSRIKRMKNHYIVCGYGEIGGAICGELKDQQLPFVVITDDESSVAAINREGHALVQGNPTADSSLKEAGIERAVGAIAVLADDADNLFISLAARELNPKILIIARGEDSGVEDRILRAGADIVVSPMKLGGRQIAELIKQQAGTSSFIGGSAPQSSVVGLRLTVYRHAADDPITVAEVLERSDAVGAAAVERPDGTFEPCPAKDATLHREDVLVLISRTDEIGKSFQKPPSGRTILLADDHRALRLLFTRKLVSAGHDVIQAASGDEALQMAFAQSPGLIVLDVNMPGRNGYQVCAALRQSQQFANVPIILYSGEETDEFIQRGHASGANMCLRKTSKSSELLARIEEAFSNQGASVSDAVKVTPETETQPPVLAPGQVEASAEVHSKPPLRVAANAGPLEASSSSSMLAQLPCDAEFDVQATLEFVEGDQHLMHDLLGAVMEETPRLMEQIRMAISQRDDQSLRLAAHTLKSSIAILGAGETSAVAAKLETLAREGNLDDVEPLHADLQSRTDALLKALETYSKEQSEK